jgi:hypothetical protein
LTHGFTVSAGSLAAGSQDVASLLSTCEKISSDAITALTGMAGAADGHPGLAGALIAAAEEGTKAFLGIGAAYAYTGKSLESTAAAYAHADLDSAQQIAAIRNPAG